MTAVILESRVRRWQLRFMLGLSPIVCFFFVLALLSSVIFNWTVTIGGVQLLGFLPAMLSLMLFPVTMGAAFLNRLKIENEQISTGNFLSSRPYPLGELSEVSGDHGNEENDFRETIVLKFKDNRTITLPLEEYDEDSLRHFLNYCKRVAPQCSYTYSDVISLESRGLLRFLISAAPSDSQILKLSKSVTEDGVLKLIREKEKLFWLLFICVSFLVATVLAGYESCLQHELARGFSTLPSWNPAAETTAFARQLAEQSPNWWTLLCLRAAISLQVTLNYLGSAGSSILPPLWCGMFLISTGFISLRAALPIFAFIDSRSIGMGTNFLHWSSVTTVSLKKESRMGESLESKLTVESKNKSQSLTIDLSRIPDLKKRLLLLQLVDRYAIKAQRNDEFLRAVHLSTDIQFTDLWLEQQSSEEAPDAESQSTVGTQLKGEEYHVDSILGFGGQATTYLAHRVKSASSGVNMPSPREEELTGQVVVKEIVLPSQADVRVMQDAISRFERGATLLAGLAHPQVVKLLDHFVENDKAYLVLQYIHGRTMREILKEIGTPDAELLRNWGLQLCDILDYLHSREPAVIHCDLAPDNLIITPSGQLKLVDFDVARVLDARAYSVIAGRPAYTPPEQFRGNPTIQSDIFALGAILYFVMNGEDPPPLGGEIDPPEPSASLSEISLLIRDCLAFEASDRPVSAAAVRERLQNLDQPRQESTREPIADTKKRSQENDKITELEQKTVIDLTIRLPEEKTKVYRDSDLKLG